MPLWRTSFSSVVRDDRWDAEAGTVYVNGGMGKVNFWIPARSERMGEGGGKSPAGSLEMLEMSCMINIISLEMLGQK